MTPYLPQSYVNTSSHNQSNNIISKHVPFPRDNVYIVGFHDEVGCCLKSQLMIEDLISFRLK